MEGTPPGVAEYDPELVRRLEEAGRAGDPGERPRTRHLRPDGRPKYTNRLILEASPYLLQHAHNPVDWYPWGDEAFERGRALGRPVLVSIGYSTCHWCHVMEEESFEDEEIARFLNENFVAIKVDREERPDVDALYMKAVQALTGTGGWPLNVWVTPDRRPFYGGTYFPPRDDPSGRWIGFLSILKGVRKAFEFQPGRVEEIGAQLTEHLRQNVSGQRGDALPTADTLASAARFYEGRFDPANGGLTGAPKFPSSLPVRFLLRWHRRSGRGEFLEMARLTLARMAGGGMYDHVGGGFHRYSTDERWLIPHFEKMLYDNALLAVAYLEAFQATGDRDFAVVVRGTLRFLTRDLAAPDGAFYSATDADSLTPDGRREEGYFFTWTSEELRSALGADLARIVGRYYGVDDRGNVGGRTVLHAADSPAAAARSLSMPEGELRAVLPEAAERLYRARSVRPAPARDEKILTAWNGLAVSAFSRAGLVLGDPGLVEQATKAALFLRENLVCDGRLRRVYKDGRRGEKAYLEDYALLVAGLLDLYEAGGDARWLEWAIELDAVLDERFEDKNQGGFFLTGDDHERLPIREKSGFDGAEPSGASVAALDLLRLAEWTADDRYRRRAERVLRYADGTLRQSPAALSEMLLAVDFFLDTPKQVVIVAPRGNREDAAPLLEAFRRRFVPNRIVAFVSEGEPGERAARLAPLLAGKNALGGRATAYVCENRVCARPTDDPAEFAAQLSR